MKKILYSLLAAAALYCAQPVETARAACGDGASTCWWIGASGNWNVNGSWSDSSGGASNGTSPASGDSVCFDSAANGNSTINATRTITNIDTSGTAAFCTAGGSAGAHTGTITQNAATTLTVSGTIFNISSSSGWTAANASTSDIAFTNTGSVTITPNSSGASRNFGDILFNGSGATFTLAGHLTSAAGSTFTFTAGNVDFAGFNVSAGIYDLSGTNSRTVTCGTGTLTTTGVSGAVWNVTNSANLTLTCNTGAINVSGTPTAYRTVSFGGKTYNNFTITSPSGNAYPVRNTQASTSSTFANLTFTNLRAFQVSGTSSTFVVSGTFSWTGLSSTAVGFMTNDTANPGYTFTPAGANSISWVCVAGMTENGAGSLAVTDGLDCGNNTNVSFTPPAATGGAPCVGC
jgi:hypothetical protein